MLEYVVLAVRPVSVNVLPESGDQLKAVLETPYVILLIEVGTPDALDSVYTAVADVTDTGVTVSDFRVDCDAVVAFANPLAAIRKIYAVFWVRPLIVIRTALVVTLLRPTERPVIALPEPSVTV